MKYIGHLITLVGAALVVIAAMAFPWYITDAVDAGGIVKGWDLAPGKLAVSVAGAAMLLTIVAIVLQRRVLVVFETLSTILIAGALVWAYFGAHSILGPQSVPFDIAMGKGFYLTMVGAAVIQFGALWIFGSNPPISLSQRPLRVAMLWNGTVVKEQIFHESHPVRIGTQTKNHFTVPDAIGMPGKMDLFRPAGGGKYSVSLTREMSGRLNLGGESVSVSEAIQNKTSGKSGTNEVTLAFDDWGMLQVGPLTIFFQFVTPVYLAGGFFGGFTSGNLAASCAAAALVHVTAVLGATFAWEEPVNYKDREHEFQRLHISAVYEEQKLEEEDKKKDDDESEDEEETTKKAEGEEGKFGDPDEDPEIESKIPRSDGKLVSKIDPKKVGLVDQLQSSQLTALGPMANIMSSNTTGLKNKMAIAMAGAGSEFRMGHGSGGMGYKGMGTGGGGEGGPGGIGGFGKIHTGLGRGLHGNVGFGRKVMRKVGKVRLGSGSTAGFCKRGNISSVVRRRARTIRNCYESRLQVKAGIKGTLRVRWTIGTDGRVLRVSSSGSLNDGGTTGCVKRVIRRLRFAKPEGGVCVVQWPFVFSGG
jgi:hypothetical protein